jgi:hypothetical protein
VVVEERREPLLRNAPFTSALLLGRIQLIALALLLGVQKRHALTVGDLLTLRFQSLFSRQRPAERRHVRQL